MAAEWVVCHDGTKGDKAYAFECLRCGAIQKMAVPIIVPCWVAAGKAFEKLHSRCKAAKAGG